MGQSSVGYFKCDTPSTKHLVLGTIFFFQFLHCLCSTDYGECSKSSYTSMVRLSVSAGYLYECYLLATRRISSFEFCDIAAVALLNATWRLLDVRVSTCGLQKEVSGSFARVADINALSASLPPPSWLFFTLFFLVEKKHHALKHISFTESLRV